MAFYMDESQLYKCQKHPSRRRVSGICPKCLRDRLVTLCPDCATARPCHCSPTPPDTSSSSSSSSTSSSSFSFFSFSRSTSRRDSVDPTLRKSRSVAVSFLRSKSKHVSSDTTVTNNNNNNNSNSNSNNDINNNNKGLLPKVSRSKINFWSVFTVNKNKKCDMHGDNTKVDEGSSKCDELSFVCDNNHNHNDNNNNNQNNIKPVMMRSRSVAVAPVTAKQKGWYLPRPIKGLRNSKPPRSVAVA